MNKLLDHLIKAYPVNKGMEIRVNLANLPYLSDIYSKFESIPNHHFKYKDYTFDYNNGWVKYSH